MGTDVLCLPPQLLAPAAPPAHSCHPIRERRWWYRLLFKLTCKRQGGLDIRVFSPIAWFSLESYVKEVWHIFPFFAARKVGTNPFYFLGIVDDGSTRYLT